MSIILNGTTGIDLPAPLPVAEGGTGVGTVTGVLKGNGTGSVTAAVEPLLPALVLPA